ncbi:hypothetical protein [Flavobacterium sp. '19STA2R22 D10 B1']|uniref:hypothetical protein n=1 Tax=Flavobacterium aerium TaxID=3037261 RepID=UPI00278C1D51|nr:hypothetical protein [Flavobacterium sp. '19STA2R22 D10 B1']
MSLVFGWYSFKIKSYTAEDLKINKEDWGNSTFEIRQKVFHLFWLPLFSLGKIYVSRRQGKLYDLPESIIAILKTKQKVRTPWYSYFIPISIVTGLIGFGVFIYVAEYMMRRNTYANNKEVYEISVNHIQKELSGLSINSYIRIINSNRPDREKAIFLKVIEIKDNKYNVQIIEAKIPRYSNEKYYLYKLRSDTLTFTKGELQKAICNEYDDFIEKKSCGFNFLGGNDKYIIDDIQYFDSPIIEGRIDWDFWDIVRRKSFQYSEQFIGDKEDRSWVISLDFQNFGVPADLVEIKNLENNIKWVDSLPMKFNTYQYLEYNTIKGNTITEPSKLKFKSILIFKDSLNKKQEYIVEGKESFFTIKKK